MEFSRDISMKDKKDIQNSGGYPIMSRRSFLKLMLSAGSAIAFDPLLRSCSLPSEPIAPPNTPPDVPPTSMPEPTKKAENLVPYGQYLIGESGIGSISKIELQANSDPTIVEKVKTLALQAIPGTKAEKLGVHIYDMVGEKGSAPFILLSVNDDENKPQSAFVGFWVDEQGVQRPPKDGKISAFYPLRVIRQDDGSTIVGIPDATNTGVQLPELFLIDDNKNTYFLPPYTDNVNSPTRPQGIKVAALDGFVPNLSPEKSLPEGIGEEFIEDIKENQFPFRATADSVFIDFGQGEKLAFQKVQNKWEMVEYHRPEKGVNVLDLSCLDFENYNFKNEGDCIQLGSGGDFFRIKGRVGSIDFEIINGLPTTYVTLHTRRKPGSSEETVRVAVQIAQDRMNIVKSFLDHKNPTFIHVTKEKDFFELAKKYPEGVEISTNFPITHIEGSLLLPQYSSMLDEQNPIAASFLHAPNDAIYILYPAYIEFTILY